MCAVRGRAPEADASVLAVIDEQLTLEGFERGVRNGVGGKHAAMPAAVERRDRDEHAVAEALIPLRLQDRPRVVRRRDVRVGDVPALERLRHQQRRVAPEGGLDIPARHVGPQCAAARRCREDQQDDSDRDAVVFQEITVTRHVGGSGAPFETGERAPPERERAAGTKATRQQMRNRVQVGVGNLPAAHPGRRRRAFGIDHEAAIALSALLTPSR